MKKYVCFALLLIFNIFLYSLSFNHSLQVEFGPNRQTGYKSLQLNTSGIYTFMSDYFGGKAGLSFDAESCDLVMNLFGKYDFIRKYFATGVNGGFFYHDLWFFDISFDQDFLFVGGVYIGCPYTKTQIYFSIYYGWKKSRIYEIQNQILFLTDSFSNYDFGITQEILRTSWNLGLSTYSFFRHDLRFIPEIYLKGKVKINDEWNVISSTKVLFSDVSNKTCHPEYIFFKAGVEWHF